MKRDLSSETLFQVLATVQEPELGADLVALRMIRDVVVSDNAVAFTINLTTPACPMKDQIEREVRDAIFEQIAGNPTVTINFTSKVTRDPRATAKLNLPIQNIIAVNSGKGGVGKSTVSVNLACALAAEGARVGLLDADIYGPNLPQMMGRLTMEPPSNGKMTPAVNHGVHFFSMGFLLKDGQSMVWRGPMLHMAIKQLFEDVAWPELDYLVVDLPPGTGDAQLSLSQTVSLRGAVTVTTPQGVAVSDAKRGISALVKLDVPLFGVVENMAGEMFGQGGGEAMAKEMGLPFLGRLTMESAVREGSDSGLPVVVSHPSSPNAQTFRKLARTVAAAISVQNQMDAQAGGAE